MQAAQVLNAPDSCAGSSSGGGGSSLPTWAIVVIAVAGTAVVFSLLTLALCCYLLRRKSRQLSPQVLPAACQKHTPGFVDCTVHHQVRWMLCCFAAHAQVRHAHSATDVLVCACS